jgi:hypothetical protein
MASDAPLTAFDPGVVQSLPMVADGSNPGFADRVLDMFTRATAARELSTRPPSGRCADHAAGAHTLKSSSATVGALALAEQARDRDAFAQPAKRRPTTGRLCCAAPTTASASALASHRAAATERKAI